MKTYYNIATAHLAGSTAEHLQEIIDHGIHNLTNNFSNDDYDYEAISDAFNAAANDLMGEINQPA